MEKINNHDDFLAALYEMLAVNDELKITPFGEELSKNQSLVSQDDTEDSGTDNQEARFPPKNEWKKCCSLCKKEHLTYICDQLSTLSQAEAA